MAAVKPTSDACKMGNRMYGEAEFLRLIYEPNRIVDGIVTMEEIPMIPLSSNNVCRMGFLPLQSL